MNDQSIRDLTLAKWAAGVWEKELRGVTLQLQEAALAYCMRQHAEWRQYWNQLNTTSADHAKVVNILMHVYNDAAVKLQLDRNDPADIHSSYQILKGMGLDEMDALHIIADILQEQTWNAKTTGDSFDMITYVERVKNTVQAIREKPELIRSGAIAVRGRKYGL